MSHMNMEMEEFLNILLWTADRLMRPTFRNLTDTYEGWAYRNGFYRRLDSLQRKHYVERDRSTPDERVYRLTWQGRLRALGGRDPQAHWGREWDGRWRLVLFDVPVAHNTCRVWLRRYLRRRGFGRLQRSVWITPDTLENEQRTLAGAKIKVESLILIEARPCAGESDAQIVARAWDYEGINRRYAKHLSILEQKPRGSLKENGAARMLLRWGHEEYKAWLAAVSHDPLLPEKIQPSSYLGQKAWSRRVEVLAKAGWPLGAFSS
jgi:phenylacetic acid degradation operon negative regulatory protein